ncbi:MAG: GAF domain-containing sensor histidine kinase [Dehalococcoidia bacterium]
MTGGSPSELPPADGQRTARELETLLEVARITASSLDIATVLDRIIDQLQRVIDYSAIAINVNEGGKHSVLARRGPGTVRPGAVMPGRRSRAFESLFDAGLPVVIEDVRGPSELAAAYRDLVGGFLDDGFEHVCSYVAVPLVGRVRPIGSITVSWPEPGHYTLEDGRLLMAFADHAALAIENARLFDEAQQRTQELETLLAVARDTSSSLELDTVLERLMDRIEPVISTNSLAINVFEGDDYVLLARRGPPGPLPGQRTAGHRPPEFNEKFSAGRAVIIDDIRGPSALAAAYRDMVGDALDTAVAHVCSYMAVPLRGRAGDFGVLTISSSDPGQYTEEDGRLLMAFADHAALAIENAGLYDESRRRASEMEALHQADEALHRSLDLRDVLVALNDLALDLLAADSGIVYTWDELTGMFEVAAIKGYSPEVENFMIELARRRPPEHAPPLEVHVVEDARLDPAADPGLLDATGLRGLVEVPIIADGHLVGFFTVGYFAPKVFGPAERHLFSTLAARAGVAVQNARLFEETRRQAREMEALHRADEALHRSLHQRDVIKAMNDLAFELLGADGSVLYTWDTDSGRGDVAATRGFSPEIEALIVSRFRESPGAPPSSPAVVAFEDTSDPSLDSVVVEATGVRSLVELPIVSGERCFGVFSVGFLRQRRFGDSERTLFSTFATRAGLAMENARLFDEAQKAASLEERQKLARELHDSVSQALYGIALGARTARMWLDRDAARAREPLDYSLGLAEVGLAEMRALIFELRPESLEAEGIVAALNRQAAAIGARYEIQVVADLATEPELTPRAREALYRIAQESMHNVVKHAGAGRIDLRLAMGSGEVILEVADDGQGFDPHGDFPGHLGLRSMSERASAIGATYEITSQPGTGTRVRVRLPLAPP